MLPAGYRWDSTLKQGAETSALTSLVWPNYLVRESDLPEPGFKVEISRQEFDQRFPVWGIRRESSGELVAYASAAQLHADLGCGELPAEGWRWAIRQALSRERPNCLCLLVACVHPGARGLGLSRLLIERAKLAARELGFATMIAPVRPTMKHQEPGTPLAEYVARTDSRGKLVDPWLALHAAAGGRIANLCEQSVVVRASLPKWREWTGKPLEASGAHVIAGGLAPLRVDLESGVGMYVEPNVWLRYETGLPAWGT